MDSKSLLAKQYETHAALLCELLASPGGEPAPAALVEHSLRSTHMLAGSASVMGLRHWAELCTAYETLLGRYQHGGFPWDDRIADVTSELIEKAEAVAAAHTADGAVDFDAVIPGEEMTALIAELVVLDEECESLPAAEMTPKVEPVVAVSLDEPEPVPAQADPIRPPAAVSEPPLPGIVAELRTSFRRLEERLESEAWKARDWDSADVDVIRRELNTIDFCARSIEKVIGDKSSQKAAQPRCGLAPLRVALRDFASELAHGTGHSVQVELSGEELAIDPRLLSTTALVLQSMITDTFSRAQARELRIDIVAGDANGALRLTLCDNGGNFISDSPLDHDDQLAFYPGLRGVINLIGRHRSVLWVEPASRGGDLRPRFEFTLPMADTGEALMTWGTGSGAFALRSTQVCAVLAVDTAGVCEDEYGRFVEVDGGRVPLFQLDELYGSAPGRGDGVVVLGALEKRIAFYVPGNGERVDAHVLGGAVPPWEGAPPYVAQIGERRVTLLDADHVISAYHNVTGTMSTDQVSGGVPEDEPEITPRQAASRVDVPAPPNHAHTRGGEKRLDVLIVEQSESMRESLTGILSSSDFNTACASDVDEAIDIIGSRAPRLVVSEFRMPTMAAKRILDKLAGTGTRIPVLVTTSQSGPTADLLVEKLGASGYLSKPLDAVEVAVRVGAHLGQEVTG